VVDEEKSQHHAAPAVRRLARELGVALSEIRGTGRNGRIVEEDLRNYIKAAMARTPAAGGNNLPELPAVDFSKFGPLNCGLWVAFAAPLPPACNARGDWFRMSPNTTKPTSPTWKHFARPRPSRPSSGAWRLTLLAFFMKATAATLKEHPSFNASLDATGENLVCKRYYHLGIAVDTSEGLVVPWCATWTAKASGSWPAS